MYICNTLTPCLIANQPQREAKRMVKRRRNLLQLVRPLVETQGTSRVVRVGKVTERKILAFIYFRLYSSTYSSWKRESMASPLLILFHFHKMSYFWGQDTWLFLYKLLCKYFFIGWMWAKFFSYFHACHSADFDMWSIPPEQRQRNTLSFFWNFDSHMLCLQGHWCQLWY